MDDKVSSRTNAETLFKKKKISPVITYHLNNNEYEAINSFLYFYSKKIHFCTIIGSGSPLVQLTLYLFQYKRFLENGSFSKEHFLKNCIIFQCLVMTLKMSLKMFSGV